MIPKIIHQLWIGARPAPVKFMDSWKDKHPEFEYIRWTEAVIKERQLKLNCLNRITEIEEINGKADIIRWEILYEYGGFFIDADGVCIEPFNDIITEVKAFASWENEKCRKGLVATGTMGFPPKHPLVRACIEWIQKNEVSFAKTKRRAWQTVGPLLLTNTYHTGKYPDVTVFPSYYFIPCHYTGEEYHGHGKVFAQQEWGSTRQQMMVYEHMNSIPISPMLLAPDKEDPYKNVSVLVSSYNTDAKHVWDCLESIVNQIGYFNIELVWINDGSDPMCTNVLTRILDRFKKVSRFTTVVYAENDKNSGIGYSLHKGIELCSHEIIIKMDSDDIMVPHRIKTQLEFMKSHPDVMISGAQLQMFNEKGDVGPPTSHASRTWEEYKLQPSNWFLNHPTLCYRKNAVIQAGNYNKSYTQIEDLDLQLRMLKMHGYVHNSNEVLLKYRLHDKQVTRNCGSSSWKQFVANTIAEIL